ncbi:hypothetical protein G6O69_04470 [Pseudenhygromyxa sp. WMMC2535]|uniref:MYXO-CTERM sorting domain-containing protein n=1 Tax=Pseudenhygromyxa sp. WMMC2535 TaxID=2712867 RepID=UPI001554B686|nr:MYXO-CTERM sorting domain-containing protein [Pseudenhygromyxa sp. WMMC2535]NVB37073.1 hypothetical protein [Pseudenhygromyxa sp. WMMC2535]
MIASLALSGCAERQLEDEADDRERACMLMAGGRVYWEDGQSRVIVDASGRSATACLCLTEEEFETQSRHDELNERLYERCEALAATFEADSNDCLEHYEAGTWLPGVWWARDELSWMGEDSPPCDAEALEGCHVSEPTPASACLFLALFALLRTRRRQTRHGDDSS